MEVDRHALLMGLAAVFAGMTMLFTVLAFTHQLFLLAVAVPFGATTYFLWYHASGRLAERTRRRASFGATAGPRGRSAAGRGPGASARFTAGARRVGAARGGTDGRGFGDGRVDASASPTGPSPVEAYRILDLSPGADADAIRRAYREKVKEVHPDTERGDEETFKRVNRAYERLTE